MKMYLKLYQMNKLFRFLWPIWDRSERVKASQHHCRTQYHYQECQYIPATTGTEDCLCCHLDDNNPHVYQNHHGSNSNNKVLDELGVSVPRAEKHPIETLLEPIRYSMAFLTLFSIMSTIIVAIILVPLESLQLLAQFLSLIVSLSGLFGTMRRSILLSSLYALAMLLFLFLQSSYFFVLLKLVQEVKINNNQGQDHHGHQNNNQKLFWQQQFYYVSFSSSSSSSSSSASETAKSSSSTETNTATGSSNNNPHRPNYLTTAAPPPLSSTASINTGWFMYDQRQVVATPPSFKTKEVHHKFQYRNPYYHYWIKKKRMKQKIIGMNEHNPEATTTSTTTTTIIPQTSPYYYRYDDTTISYDQNQYYQLPSSSVHVRRITRMLNEELSYLSLLTVPMIAWLPPSLFMETVAVLILTMQALAGGCFLYALHRSEPYRRKCRMLQRNGDYGPPSGGGCDSGYHIKLPIYIDY